MYETSKWYLFKDNVSVYNAVIVRAPKVKLYALATPIYKP